MDVLLMVGLCSERNLRAGTIAGALSTDALMGSDTPFDPRIHQLRPHSGQQRLASAYLSLMADSEIRASHVTGDDKVQIEQDWINFQAVVPDPGVFGGLALSNGVEIAVCQ